MKACTRERLALETDLRLALERGALAIHYQPQIELATGRVTGMKALVRWQSPVRRLVAPAAFIPLAEETGVIRSLGQWVLEEACRLPRPEPVGRGRGRGDSGSDGEGARAGLRAGPGLLFRPAAAAGAGRRLRPAAAATRRTE